MHNLACSLFTMVITTIVKVKTLNKSTKSTNENTKHYKSTKQSLVSFRKSCSSQCSKVLNCVMEWQFADYQRVTINQSVNGVTSNPVNCMCCIFLPQTWEYGTYYYTNQAHSWFIKIGCPKPCVCVSIHHVS